MYMRKAICPYFGVCGGCSAQHIEYELQLENKKKMLSSALEFPDIQVFSGNEFWYRNRMDMVFHPTGIGFREKGKWWKAVDVKECMISNKRLNELISEVRDFFKEIDAFDVKKHTGTFRYAVIRTPSQDSDISFVLNSDSTRLSDALARVGEFAKITSSNNVLAAYVKPKSDLSVTEECFVIKGSDMLHETYFGKTFFYSAQGFFQNNYEMALKMHEYCHKLLSFYDTGKAHLLDLYGGVGTFGILNSDLFKNVTIVESYEPSILAAKRNIQANNVTNADAIVLDAKKLKNLDLPKPLFIITDPPRSGMHPETIHQLQKLEPEVIIYVSCNPQQVSKDIPKFKDYKIKSAALFDLFPQTLHMESVIELVR